MEFILHYVWQHHIFDATALETDRGEALEIIDPGIHNISQSGPDFFNAKLKIAGMLWAGNVEIHERSSDWYRHHHDQDSAYNNVILHVVSETDREVLTQDGKTLPQLILKVPEDLMENYRELLNEETYPPCYRIIPQIPEMISHAWMSRLAVERLEEKTLRIHNYLERTGGDWERTFFITLARNFGFGTNAQTFEQWAFAIAPSAIGKHRDNLFQVEAFFLGQAGLLDSASVPVERQDSYFRRLQQEYVFFQHKFGLVPLAAGQWKFGRLRPQNFPHVRLSQMARLYHECRVDFSRLLETENVKGLHELFKVGVTDYWKTHYCFGHPGTSSDKVLRKSSLNLLIINSVAPLLFAYGRQMTDENMTERAFGLLESLPPESNYITRCWNRAGIHVTSAADSQALIQLRKNYCDRKDCLRCRFGTEYLRNRK